MLQVISLDRDTEQRLLLLHLSKTFLFPIILSFYFSYYFQ